MTTIAVVGLFWLFGTGLLAPMLFGRDADVQDKLPSRYEHLRATSTYRSVQPSRAAAQTTVALWPSLTWRAGPHPSPAPAAEIAVR
jgi:hypothetical protein